MSCIPLTPSQKTELQRELESLEKQIAKYEEIEPRREQTIYRREEVDGGFATGFNFYDGIIVAYENEREALDGQYVENPITEQDIINPASVVFSRTTPQNPVTNIIRIAQFDGSPLVTTDNEILGFQSDAGILVASSEQYWISKQTEMQNWLVNGFGGTTPIDIADVELLTAIDPSTTIIELEDSSMQATFAIGDTFVLHNGGEQIGVLVRSIINQDVMAGEYELEISNLTAGFCSVGAGIDTTWAGFDNAERSTKTASYQQLLNDMITLLELDITNRVDKLDEQLTAIALNDDPDLNPNAAINVNSSKTFLENYLLTTDISNAGLATLDSEEATRTAQITARIAEIIAAYTSQPSGNFYNLRYGFANDRGNTTRGSLRLLKFEESTDAVIAEIKANSQARINAINSLLNQSCS